MKTINMLENVGRFTPPPKSPIMIYPKSSVRFTPQNCQVCFTLKSYIDFISYFLAA